MVQECGPGSGVYMDRRDMAVDPDAFGDNVAGDGSLVCQLLSFCLEHNSAAV